MLFVEHDDDSSPRVSFEGPRSSCAYPFHPLLLVNGLSGKSFSYDKLHQEPLKLTVIKLDGSTFDVEVSRTAKVAELKQAVEDVFSHLPRTGPGKVSWSHVWGHFCLSYQGQKLVMDNENIADYGIKDGDQLHFVRHISINYNLVKKRSNGEDYDFYPPRVSMCSEDKEDESDENHDRDEQKYQESEDEDDVRRGESSGQFLYHKLASPKKKSGCSCFPSRFSDGFLGGFRNMLRLDSNKTIIQREALKDV